MSRWLSLRAVVALLVLSFFAAFLASPPAAVPSSARAAALPCDAVVCPERLHYGVWRPGLPSDLSVVSDFASLTGKDPNVVLFFQSWLENLNVDAFRQVSSSGRLPMVTWEPHDFANPSAETFPLEDVAAGVFDDYLRQQASRVKRFDGKVAIRLAHEMNASWYPWGANVNGNSPEAYRAMFRHVVDVFHAAGVRNVIWVWSPNLDDSATEELAPFYPGDSYVDWVGLSGYFFSPSDTFERRYRATLDQLDSFAPSKSIYVTETSVTPDPAGDRAALVRSLLRGLLDTPRLVGFNWFDESKVRDWRLATHPEAVGAFSEEISSPWFGYRNGTYSAIPPYSQAPPRITGLVRSGEALTVDQGSWRTSAAAGTPTFSGRWHLCADTFSTVSCSPTEQVGSSFVLTDDLVGSSLRYQLTASTSAGETVVWSAATSSVVAQPATPAVPDVVGYSTALRLVFPPVPANATHWRVTFDGGVKPLVPVSEDDYWFPNLVTGASHSWALEAVSASSSDLLASDAVSGSAVTIPYVAPPKVSVLGSAATFSFPSAPAGVSSWRLTVDGVPFVLPSSSSSHVVDGLVLGEDHPWTFTGLAAGSSSPLRSGVLSLPLPPGAPSVPQVVSHKGALRVVFPSVPDGASSWRLTVDGVAKPLVPVSKADYWLTGLVDGRSYELGLSAVAGTSPSAAVSVSAVPMSGLHVPYFYGADREVTFRLPPVPAGAGHWVLAVDGVSEVVPLSASTWTVSVPSPGQHSWSLVAIAAGSVTPPVGGSFSTLVPATAPQVVSYGSALKVVFPEPPAGATRWRVFVDGVSKGSTVVSSSHLWVTGLVDGRTYEVTAVGVAGSVVSAGVPLSAVPMPNLHVPYVGVSGDAARMKLPPVPAGAVSWRLTLDGVPVSFPVGGTYREMPGLVPGPHSWSLVAVVGDSATPPVSGSFVSVPASPAAPVLSSGPGELGVVFPPVPAGAVSWRVLVDGIEHGTVPVAEPSYRVPGLVDGMSYRVGLAALAPSGASKVVTVSGVPMPLPAAASVEVVGSTATFALPPVPAGAVSWELLVDDQFFSFPVSERSRSVPGLALGVEHGWALRAVAGASRTPRVKGVPFVPLAVPAAPVVTSYGSALRVSFPPVPAGVSHWRVTLDGRPKPLVAVSASSYWLTGLVDGTSYEVGLAAVAGSVVSAPALLSGVPMPNLHVPYVALDGDSASWKLPPVPAGASHWRLTVDTSSALFPVGEPYRVVSGLSAGPHSWSLVAVAGGSATPPVAGSFEVLAPPPAPSPEEVVLPAPAAPSLEAHREALKVSFPPVPEGATHWQLSIDGRTKPLVAVGSEAYWLTGLSEGVPYRVSLSAVEGSSISAPVEVVGVPMVSTYVRHVDPGAASLLFQLPASPLGAEEWVVRVGDVERVFPASGEPGDFVVDGLVSGEHTWSVVASAADSSTPVISGTVTLP